MLHPKHLHVILALLILCCSAPLMAAEKNKQKIYTEDQFLNIFGNKTGSQLQEVIGAPIRKSLPVKPSNADSMLPHPVGKNEKRPAQVEMWYYANLVTYDGKRTYRSTELTLVNGRVQSIAFFNNK